ncbi:MAG: hypothetical protein AAGM16_03450 [Pseudomonadota bacterium]
MKSLNAFILTSALALLAVPAAASVNKSVRIEAGATSEGASSVNGSIKVGEGAYVNGELGTVNGSIKLASGVTARDVESVNGKISIGDDSNIASSETVNGRNYLGERVQVSGNVTTVNGGIDARQGTTIGGDVKAVNGGIGLFGVQVMGDLSNVNGDINLTEGTRINGNVIVRKPKRMGWSWGKRDPSRVVIGPNVVIEGELELQRKVRLYVHETAKIGSIIGDDVEMETYSGSEP